MWQEGVGRGREDQMKGRTKVREGTYCGRQLEDGGGEEAEEMGVRGQA